MLEQEKRLCHSFSSSLDVSSGPDTPRDLGKGILETESDEEAKTYYQKALSRTEKGPETIADIVRNFEEMRTEVTERITEKLKSDSEPGILLQEYKRSAYDRFGEVEFPPALIQDEEVRTWMDRRIALGEELRANVQTDPTQLEDEESGEASREEANSHFYETLANRPSLSHVPDSIGQVHSANGEILGTAIFLPSQEVVISCGRTLLDEQQTSSSATGEEDNLAFLRNMIIKTGSGRVIHLSGAERFTGDSGSPHERLHIRLPNVNVATSPEQNVMQIASHAPKSGDRVYIFNPNHARGAIAATARNAQSILSGRQEFSQVSSDAKTILQGNDLVITTEQGDLVAMIEGGAGGGAQGAGMGAARRTAIGWRQLTQESQSLHGPFMQNA